MPYVLIEYNQASRWPALHSDILYDTWDEAAVARNEAMAHTADIGRAETFAIASVLIEDEAS